MNNYSKTVLVIQAHPDDTEIFCSGTLALLKNLGFKNVVSMIPKKIYEFNSRIKRKIFTYYIVYIS